MKNIVNRIDTGEYRICNECKKTYKKEIFPYKRIELCLDCWERKHKRRLYEYRRRIIKGYDETPAEYYFLEELIDEKEKGGIMICKHSKYINMFIRFMKTSNFNKYITPFLNAYPECPSLLMLNALLKLSINEIDVDPIKHDIKLSIELAYKKYKIRKNLVNDFILWAIEHIKKINQELALELYKELVRIIE